MSKCYMAIKLDPLDAMKGRLPADYDRYPCALCDTCDSAIEYFKSANSKTDFPALVDKLGVPEVDVILVYDVKYPVPEGITMDTTRYMQMCEGAPTAQYATIHQDNVFPTARLEGGELDELGEIVCFRMDVNAQLEQMQQCYPTCDGLTEWFQRIADSVMHDTFPPIGIHSQTYAETFYAIRESNPQLSQEIVILKAAALAAEQIADTHQEWATEFLEVAEGAQEALRFRCAQELVFFEPTEYLTRMMGKVPEDYQADFLNVFNETLESVQENHPEMSIEQQSVSAMDQTLYTIENSIIDRQMEGVFGNGPKLTREEYLALDATKQVFIELRANAHANVELVNKMLDELDEHDSWNIDEHDHDE